MAGRICGPGARGRVGARRDGSKDCRHLEKWPYQNGASLGAMRQRILGWHTPPCHRRMVITTLFNVLLAALQRRQVLYHTRWSLGGGGGATGTETKTHTYPVAGGVDCSPLACNQESINDSFALFGADWIGFGAGAKENSIPHRGPWG